MDDIRFSPKEIQDLINGGQITAQTVQQIPNSQDRSVAIALLRKSGSTEATMGPATPESRINAAIAERFGRNGAQPLPQNREYRLGPESDTVMGPGSAAVMGPGIALKAAGPMLQGGAKAMSAAAARHPILTAGAAAVASQLSKKLGVPADLANVVSEMFALKGAMGGGLGTIEGGSGLSNVSKVEPSLSEIEQNVTQGGVKGLGYQPASGAELDSVEKSIFGSPTPKRTYSPNIDTQSTTDDIRQMIGDHSGNGPTPVKWEDPTMRSAVEHLKRTVKRRSPAPPQDNNDDD